MSHAALPDWVPVDYAQPSPDDDGEVKEEPLSATLRLAVELLADATQPRPQGCRFDPAARLAFEPRWMAAFESLNVCKAATRVSGTDIGFHAICASRVAEHPQGDAPTLQWILELHTLLAVVSVQHTSASRAYWPSPEAREELWRLAAGVVTHFFVQKWPKQLKALVAELEKAPAWRPPDALLRLYEARHMPASLRLALEERALAAEAQRKLGKTDVRDATSEENSGALWRSSAEELVAQIVPRAARVYFKVEFDEALLRRYPPHPDAAVRFTAATAKRVRRWVRRRCRVEQVEELTELFRDTAMELFLPLGAETARTRDRETMHDVVKPLTLLEAEIGADLAQHLQDMTIGQGVGLGTLAQHPLFADAVLLALFAFACMQRLLFKWHLDYYTHAPQQKRERMDRAEFRLTDDKRPMVVRACRRYWLFDRRRMVPAGGFSHALLLWLHVVGTRHDCLLEDDQDIRALYTDFFPAGQTHTVEEEEERKEGDHGQQ